MLLVAYKLSSMTLLFPVVYYGVVFFERFYFKQEIELPLTHFATLKDSFFGNLDLERRLYLD